MFSSWGQNRSIRVCFTASKAWEALSCMCTTIQPRQGKTSTSVVLKWCHKQGGEHGKIQVQSQTRDRKLSHSRNYSFHAYNFKSFCLFILFSPQATWKANLLWQGGIITRLMSTHAIYSFTTSDHKLCIWDATRAYRAIKWTSFSTFHCWMDE